MTSKVRADTSGSMAVSAGRRQEPAGARRTTHTGEHGARVVTHSLHTSHARQSLGLEGAGAQGRASASALGCEALAFLLKK